MRATIIITIEDDTPEEKLQEEGFTTEGMARLYASGFAEILNEIDDAGGRVKKKLSVVLTDNTKKEANQ